MWGRFDLPYQRDLESGRYVHTGQSAGWALVNATSRRSLSLLCGKMGKLSAIICVPFGAETFLPDNRHFPCIVGNGNGAGFRIQMGFSRSSPCLHRPEFNV